MYVYLRSTLCHRLELRSDLRRQWFFDCACDRCSDPTDSGSFVSSRACPECPGGWLVPERPLDHDSDWVCLRRGGRRAPSPPCAGRVSREEILSRESEDEEEVARPARESGRPGAAAAAAAELVARRGAHPNHHLVLRLKLSFLEAWESLEAPAPEDDLTAEEFCRDLLSVCDLVDVGRTRLKDRLRRLRIRARMKTELMKIREARGKVTRNEGEKTPLAISLEMSELHLQ